MDDLQRVDCFEKLRGHLLKYCPELDKHGLAIGDGACSKKSLQELVTLLIAQVAGLDLETAESRRRIQRFVSALEDVSPSHGVAESESFSGWQIREDGGVWQRLPNGKMRRDICRSLSNLNSLVQDPAQGGEFFDKEWRRREHLPGKMQWLQRLLPCLSQIALFRYAASLGYPLCVPDSAVATFLFRLGIIEKAQRNMAGFVEVCHAVQSIATLTGRTAAEIGGWIRMFCGANSLGADAALCRRDPECTECPLRSHCQYAKHVRPVAAGRDEALPFKQWQPSLLPREKLMRNGPDRLDDVDILAILLRTGAGGTNVMDLSRMLLQEFGDLQGIDDASLIELQKIHGIGRNKAIELKAAMELGRRVAFRPIRPGDPVRSSADVFQGYRARFSQVKQEEFILLMLDNKNVIIREEVISRGSLNASIVHPREVFKAAIRASAAAVLFLHNHPSGDPAPSLDDRNVTQRLREAAELLQIRMLDHVIMGRNSYFSFADDQIHQGSV